MFSASISAEQRLMVTLRYLATGTSMTNPLYDWCISVAALSSIIPKTCEAIYNTLRREYLSTPTTEAKWREISQDLEEHGNFPNAPGTSTFSVNRVSILETNVCPLNSKHMPIYIYNLPAFVF